MDEEHEKIKTNIETDTVLLKNGIDEYQFKSNATEEIEDNNNVEAIMYEQRMTDAAEHELFLSPDALLRFKNANIRNQ
jgi:hypothetical protein